MGLAPGFTLRPARRDDLPGINRIYNDAIRDTTATWDEAPWPMSQREEWWEEHEADPTSPVFVVAHEDDVAGFAYLSWYRSKTGYRFTREDTVYVDPRFHRCGIGQALLEAAIEAGRAHGIHALIAAIEASNEASLALHARLGFERCSLEREVGFKFGRWLDLVHMQLIYR